MWHTAKKMGKPMKTKNELFQDALNKQGRLPVTFDLREIEELLPEITNINAVDRSYQNTALISALHSTRSEPSRHFLSALIEKKIDIDARNHMHNTALMLASEAGYLDTVNILLAAGADTEVIDEDGNTAICYAASGKHLHVMKALLTAGANNNPFRLQEHCGIIELLEQDTANDHTDVLYILKNFGTFQYRLKEVGFDENKLDTEDMEVYTSCRDPITLEIINDPISVSSGITYDRKSLRDRFESKKDLVTQEIPATIPCPITRLPIQRGELTNSTHVITKGMINRFVLKQETKFRRHLQTDASSHSALASDLGLFSKPQHAEPSASAPSLGAKGSNLPF